MTYIHKTAEIIGNVKIGEDSSVWPYAVLRADEGDISIGSKTSIQDHVVIHGKNVSIGDRCTIGHSSIIHGCKIGNDCLIGMGAIILSNSKIGDNCIIGAGSVITEGKEIPSGSLVLGVPGKIVREVNESDKERIKKSWKVYIELAKNAEK